MKQYISAIRAVAYAAVSILLSWVVASRLNAMRTAGPEVTFFGTLFWGFLIACVLIGVSCYAFMAYVRQHKEFRSDVVLCVVVGVLLMITVLVSFLRYGGISGTFDEEGYLVVNWCAVLLSVLPLPFAVRACIAAVPREPKPRVAAVKRIVAAAAALLYVVLIVTGPLFRTLLYTGGAAV